MGSSIFTWPSHTITTRPVLGLLTRQASCGKDSRWLLPEQSRDASMQRKARCSVFDIRFGSRNMESLSQNGRGPSAVAKRAVSLLQGSVRQASLHQLGVRYYSYSSKEMMDENAHAHSQLRASLKGKKRGQSSSAPEGALANRGKRNMGYRQRYPWEKGSSLITEPAKRRKPRVEQAPPQGLIRAQAERVELPPQLPEGDDGSIFAALKAHKKARERKFKLLLGAPTEESRIKADQEVMQTWEVYRARCVDPVRVRENEQLGRRKDGWESWERMSAVEKRQEEKRERERYLPEDASAPTPNQRFPGDKGNALVNGKSLVEMNQARLEAWKKLAGNPPAAGLKPQALKGQKLTGKDRPIVSKRRRRQLEYWAGGEL